MDEKISINDIMNLLTQENNKLKQDLNKQIN